MPLNNEDQQSIVKYLPEDLRLSETSYLSEEEFLHALAIKVVYMLHYNNGVFFQLLYKMDVLEHKLKAALQSEDVALAIAKLILERQLAKLESRKANPASEATDKDLEW